MRGYVSTTSEGATGTFLAGNDKQNSVRAFITTEQDQIRASHTIKEFSSEAEANKDLDAILDTYESWGIETLSAPGIDFRSSIAGNYRIFCTILSSSGSKPFLGDEINIRSGQVQCEAVAVYSNFVSIFSSDVDGDYMSLKDFESILYEIDQIFTNT